MADIDIVLERLVTEPQFRTELAQDAAAALAAYDLSQQDLELLASSLDDGDDAQRGVEQRTSKSAMVGLLASLTGGGGAGRSGPGNPGKPEVCDVPVRNQQPIGGGVTDRLNSQPAGSVTVPIGSSRGPEIVPPVLDADSKDSAGLSQQAPLEDAGRKHVAGIKFQDAHVSQQAPVDDELAGQHVDRPMVGEISVSRSVTAPGEGDAKIREAQNSLDAIRRSTGLSDADITSGGQAAPAGDPQWDGGEQETQRGNFKIPPGRVSEQTPPADGDGDRWHDKWTPRGVHEDVAPAEVGAKRSEAEVNLDSVRQTAALSDSDIAASRNAAPPADPQWDSSGDRMHHWKYEPSLRQDAPPAAAWDGGTERSGTPVAADVDGDTDRAGIKIEIGAAGQRLPGDIPIDDSPASQPTWNTTDSFLTVEDE